MHNMIEGFNRKINELKQKCSKLFKTNVKLKRKMRSKKTNFALKKRRKYKSNVALRHEKYTTLYNLRSFKPFCLPFTLVYFIFQIIEHYDNVGFDVEPVLPVLYCIPCYCFGVVHCNLIEYNKL